MATVNVMHFTHSQNVTSSCYCHSNAHYNLPTSHFLPSTATVMQYSPSKMSIPPAPVTKMHKKPPNLSLPHFKCPSNALYPLPNCLVYINAQYTLPNSYFHWSNVTRMHSPHTKNLKFHSNTTRPPNLSLPPANCHSSAQ